MTINEETRRRFEATPINGFLGSELVEQTDERVVVRAPIKHEFLQENGVVQGGIVSALADTVAVYLVIPHIGPDKRVSGVEFKMNFLNPGSPENGDLIASSRLIKRGRTIAVCEAEVAQGEETLAHGLFTYLIY